MLTMFFSIEPEISILIFFFILSQIFKKNNHLVENNNISFIIWIHKLLCNHCFKTMTV